MGNHIGIGLNLPLQCVEYEKITKEDLEIYGKNLAVHTAAIIVTFHRAITNFHIEINLKLILNWIPLRSSCYF